MADSNPDSIKRYTPPVHRIMANSRQDAESLATIPAVTNLGGNTQPRNRASNWRKSGDRAEKANYSYSNDGEKSHVPSLKNLPPIIHHETFVSNAQNDYSQTRLVPLEGCCASEAAQLLSDRWAAAMDLYNDQSNDSPDKPVMYSGYSGSSRGHGPMKLPHQMNFLEELRRAVDAQTGLAPTVNTHN